MNIVCWGEPLKSTNPELLKAEFHFNYWPKSISDHTQKTPYLDIGVKFYEYKDLEKFHFWFPISEKEDFSKKNFKDLGCLLKDNDLASSIFNKSLHIASDGTKPKQSLVTIQNKESNNSFIVYELAEEDFSISSILGGKCLTIKLENIINVSDSRPIYIRFRLKGTFLKKIERVVRVKNRLFQSAFTQTSYIDFRFNDTRSMHKSLREHYLNEKHSKLEISKVHFLLMTRSEEEVTTPANIDARILEADIWEKYLEHKICNVCVANHWRFEPSANKPLETCIVYARYKVLQCNFSTIILYIFILYIMTLFFNITSAVIYDYFTLTLQLLI